MSGFPWYIRLGSGGYQRICNQEYPNPPVNWLFVSGKAIANCGDSCCIIKPETTILISTKPNGPCIIWARVKRRYERLQLRSAITTQNMWFTVCSDRGPYVAIPLFRLCLWLKLPIGRMTFQSFDVRVRHWSSRSGLVFLGSCKMACRQVYMR